MFARSESDALVESYGHAKTDNVLKSLTEGQDFCSDVLPGIFEYILLFSGF